MPFQDFREFLDALRNAGELLELDRAVSPELEVAKAMRTSSRDQIDHKQCPPMASWVYPARASDRPKGPAKG
jgi:3-polyprenyl-4-hydroxybenzoate decarboxylase